MRAIGLSTPDVAMQASLALLDFLFFNLARLWATSTGLEAQGLSQRMLVACFAFAASSRLALQSVMCV